MEAARSYWYAARTRYGQELKIRDRLVREGVDYFIPTVTSSGPRKEKAAISNLVFLRASKAEALDMANRGGVRMKYIIDCTTRTLLVVPDKQMEDFRRVFEQAEEITSEPLALGDRVVVTQGPLKGVEGYVIEFQGKCYVVVSLLESVFAKAKVPRTWLAKIQTDKNGK
ncbi:MAG: UpxY family transcription antiterminator [Bacteroidales bacterium]|nr:UpxY family transcription antiterminator [Bacteroidales bacterium]